MMSTRWKKRMITLGWLVCTLAGVTVLFAGGRKKDSKTCTSIAVEITGPGDHFFVEEKELEGLLNGTGNLTGRPLESINLHTLEKRLENNKWIRNAELFFDNKQVLHALVEERQPIARIFTVGGYSYYIDSSCQKLPLSDNRSARVPMFTNFPSDRTRLSRLDSTYMVAIKDVAQYINAQPFWTAQVAQVNINADRELEMIPTVGSHTVLLGKPEDVEEKLNRLFSFYKQVWTKVGLEKYSVIDVQYKGQVVATRKEAGSMGQLVDSAAARKALEEIMAKKDNNDSSLMVAGNVNSKPTPPANAGAVQANEVASTKAVDRKLTEKTSTAQGAANLVQQKKPAANNTLPVAAKVAQAKPKITVKPNEDKGAAIVVGAKTAGNKVPKAVMEKKSNN